MKLLPLLVTVTMMLTCDAFLGRNQAHISQAGIISPFMKLCLRSKGQLEPATIRSTAVDLRRNIAIRDTKWKYASRCPLLSQSPLL
jgi:hypothetical protein